MKKDNFNFNPEIKGHMKLQIFEGSKCVLEKEKDNFLGIAVKRWMLSMGMGLFGYFTRYSASESKFSQFPQYNMITHFMLTSNTSAVPVDETLFPGALIGWSDYQLYSGTDTKRGTINITESGLQEGTMELKLVFDWPTHAANGTFGTLGFGRLAAVPKIWPLDEQLQHLGDSKVCINDDIIYITTNKELYMYNFSSKICTYLGALSSNNQKGIFYYNNRIYYTYDAGAEDALCYFDLSTKTNVLITSNLATSDDSVWCATDGSYIFCGYSRAGEYKIYKLNMNGSLIVTKTLYTNIKFATYNCTIDNGDFLCSDGTRLNISDLFDLNIETYSGSADYPLDQYPIVRYGLSYYKGAIQFFPSPYESTKNDGEAGYTSNCFGLYSKAESLGTCVVLDTPVTKNNTQTMKVTYTISITMP